MSVSLSLSSGEETIQAATAAEEHAWNVQRLSMTVREPEHRVWMYERPGIVLGRSQRGTATATGTAVSIVTRESGGGAVAVGPWLVGVSVALPIGHPLVTPGLVDSYRWIGEMHSRVLRRFDVHADAVSPDALRALRANISGEVRWACFGSLSPWEVVGRGRRKLVGLAQVRRRTGVMIVGGTLIAAPDWHALAASMGKPPADADRLSESTTNCERESGRRISASELSTALDDALRARIA